MSAGAFYFQKDSLLLPGGAALPSADMEISPDQAGDFPFSDIFTVPAITGGAFGGDISCVYVPPDAPLPPRLQAIPVRQVLSVLPCHAAGEDSQSARMLRAFHVAQWRRDSRFCGNCGAANTDAPDELARLCPACGRTEFPRISPAVITLITNDEGKALLAHNRKFAAGMYSLIAGFTEAGESLEATVARETREEAGIEVRDIRYAISQPWPFPNSLMLGFTARYASGVVKPDGIEIEDARWFGKDDLPKLPGPGSVSRHLIEHWLAGQ